MPDRKGFRLSAAQCALLFAGGVLAAILVDLHVSAGAHSKEAAAVGSKTATGGRVITSKLQLIATASDPAIGTPAPDFAVPDEKGKTVRLSQLMGRPLVLNFLSDTTACRNLWNLERQQILSRYGKRVVVVTVLGSRTPRPFARDPAATYDSYWLYSSDPGLRKQYHALTRPRTWVIGNGGLLRETHAAGATPEAIVNQAEDAVAILATCIPIEHLPGQQASER